MAETENRVLYPLVTVPAILHTVSMHSLTLKYLFTCVWACVHTGLLAGQLICVREGEVERQGKERGEWEKERMVSMS